MKNRVLVFVSVIIFFVFSKIAFGGFGVIALAGGGGGIGTVNPFQRPGPVSAPGGIDSGSTPSSPRNEAGVGDRKKSNNDSKK